MPEDIGRFSKFFIQVGGFMSHLLQFCYISLIIYCLFSIEGLINDQPAWYRNEVKFSDWRNVKEVEYSTNAVVANWYSGGHSQYFRKEQMKQIDSELDKGDTVKIGVDCQALTPISRQFLEEKFLADNYFRLSDGEVITIKMWKKNNLIRFEEFRN